MANVISWVVFGLFVAIAMVSHSGEPIFLATGPYAYGKYIAWGLFLGFLGYSYYCSTKENIFKTLKKIFPYYWARQIGLDLYLGLVVFLFIIYLVEGSLLVTLLWLLPILLFANLATLLYFAMNYAAIVALLVQLQ